MTSSFFDSSPWEELSTGGRRGEGPSRFPDSAEWWEQVRVLMEAETGMDLSGSRAGRLGEAVSQIFKKERILGGRFDDSLKDRTKFVELVTAQLTVGESFFFRNENHMHVLRTKILPQLIQENSHRRELRVWSAGCATGEEPYSLSILLEELLGTRSDWLASILGTDINHDFLSRARRGLYRKWSFRQTRVHEDNRFFHRINDLYQVQEKIRRQVRFEYLNLVKDVYPSWMTGTIGLDLILFRNVAIYLKPEITEEILRRFFQALRPGGWLLLGETEVTLAPTLNFEVHRFSHATLYRRPIDAVEAPRPPKLVSTPPAIPVELPFIDPRPFVPVLPAWVPLPQASLKGASEAVSPSERPSEKGGLSRDPDEVRNQIMKTADPRVRSQQRRHLIQVLLENAQVMNARHELGICLREDPMCVELHLLDGGLSEDHGQIMAAEQAYRRALYLDRSSPLVHFHLGRILKQQGNLFESRQCFRTALKLIEGHDDQSLVEHGDGVCYGRLHEMVAMMMGDESG